MRHLPEPCGGKKKKKEEEEKERWDNEMK